MKEYIKRACLVNLNTSINIMTRSFSLEEIYYTKVFLIKTINKEVEVGR